MKNRTLMMSRCIVALVGLVMLTAQTGQCSVNFQFPTGGILNGCDVAMFPTASPEGMVDLGNGRVLVALYSDGIYTFTMPSSLQTCPSSPPAATRLSGYHVRGMAMAFDGTIYGNDNSGYIGIINPNTGVETQIKSLGVIAGLGMVLDPVTGNIDVTVNSGGTPTVVEISGLSGIPKATLLVTLTGAGFADGLAWSCDGKTLLVADKGQNGNGKNNQVIAYDRSTKKLSYLVFPDNTYPDGMAFGAPNTPLAKYAYTNTNDGHIYQFSLPPNLPNVTAVALNGGDGDFVTVDSQGHLLATQPGLITAVYWKQGHGAGGFVLPGGSLCASLHCATEAATTPRCLTGQNATTVAALADAACSVSNCGGCAAVNLDLTALITLLKDNNIDGCLNSAITAAETLYSQCPCNPDPTKCAVPCDPANGCGPCPSCFINSSDWLDEDDPRIRDFLGRGHSR